MSAGGWLNGTVTRKAGISSSNARSKSTANQVQSTSTTIFGGGVKDPSGRTSEYFSMDDQCPVCRSDRYLNTKLRLLVSSCYHKMCESCIDRLFTLGPAPCPICQKQLRKLAFMPQTFEDLGVEKEVAVRRRIAKEFNKRREDFETLRQYNDYLEEIEEITFNLINGVDLQATEARIAANRAENAAISALNLQRDEHYAQSLREQEDAERKEREWRAAEARRAEEAEREGKEAERREILERLEMGSVGDAEKVIRKSRKEAMKRSEAAKSAAGPSPMQSHASLLRTRAAANSVIPDPPHVPLQDDWYAYDDLFTLRDNYEDGASEAVRRDREGIMRAGGYMVEQAWERAIRCAVAGLEIAPIGYDVIMGSV